MKKNIILLISLVILFTLALSACGGGDVAATPEPVVEKTILSGDVVAEGRLEPIHAANLTFQARGVVEEVFVQAGDAVREGDVLARLSNAGEAEANLLIAQNAYDALLRNESGDRARLWKAYLDAQAARESAEKEWDDLNVTAIEDNIKDLEGDVQDFKDALKDAQDEFDKYKDLDKDNAKRKDAKDALDKAQDDLNAKVRDVQTESRKRDDVKAVYDAALAAEAEAKYQYEISQDGPNADQFALAKANLEAAQDALSNYVITAPFSGKVADVNVKAGEQVLPDTRVVSVVDDSQWLVETTDVTELEAVNLKVGQAVTMTPDALPDLELKGTVAEISGAYTQSGGDILYTVRVRVDGSDSRLKWGMTVETIFRTVE